MLPWLQRLYCACNVALSPEVATLPAAGAAILDIRWRQRHSCRHPGRRCDAAAGGASAQCRYVCVAHRAATFIHCPLQRRLLLSTHIQSSAGGMRHLPLVDSHHEDGSRACPAGEIDAFNIKSKLRGSACTPVLKNSCARCCTCTSNLALHMAFEASHRDSVTENAASLMRLSAAVPHRARLGTH